MDTPLITSSRVHGIRVVVYTILQTVFHWIVLGASLTCIVNVLLLHCIVLGTIPWMDTPLITSSRVHGIRVVVYTILQTVFHWIVLGASLTCTYLRLILICIIIVRLAIRETFIVCLIIRYIPTPATTPFRIHSSNSIFLLRLTRFGSVVFIYFSLAPSTIADSRYRPFISQAVVVVSSLFVIFISLSFKPFIS